jgi:hypothetical protein
VPSSYKKTDALPLFLLADMFFEFAGNFLKAAGSHVPTTRKKLIKFKREYYILTLNAFKSSANSETFGVQ